jgi:hypothetical protein
MPRDLESVIAEALDPQTDGFYPDDLDEARYLVAVVREYLLSDESIRVIDKHMASILMDDDMPCIDDYRAALAAALGESS